MDDNTTADSTKRLVRVTSVTVLALLFGGAIVYGLVMTPVAASAQVNGFGVQDATFEAEAVDAIDVGDMNAEAQWSDLPAEVEDATVAYYVEGPSGEMQETLTYTCSPAEEQADCIYEGTADSGQVSWDAAHGYVGVLRQTDWTNDDFEPAPGEQVSHTLEMEVEVTIGWDDGSLTESATDTTTITITNPTESADPAMTVDHNTLSVIVSGEGVEEVEENG